VVLEASNPPTRIGRYEIIRPLGEGAMAQVFLAELQTFGGFRRKVALKVVRPEFARDPKFGQLMSREAMIGSLLQHPNVIETLEFNEADGRMFLALEFVEGQTVEDLLKASKDESGAGLPLDLAIEIIVQVLKGLAYAHSLRSAEDEAMGIIHRDLKPGNIMVSRHGVVKVMDFGIAKAKVAAATITAAGQVRGTPIYMAPEQVMGKPLDHRCDQFAAATVLYELVTGEQLFIARNLIEIMRRVSRAEVGDAIGKLNRYHPGLGSIAERMWKPDAEHRWADCDEAAVAIEELLPAVKRRIADGEVPLTVDDATPEPEAEPEPVKNIAAPVDTAPQQRQRTSRRRAQKPKESSGGLLGMLGLRKPKEEEPPKRRRRKKRRQGETGPMSGRGGASTTGSMRKRRRRKRPAGQTESQPIEDTRPQNPPVQAEPEPERAPEPQAEPPLEPSPITLEDSGPPDVGGRLEANPLLSTVAEEGMDSESPPPEPEPLRDSIPMDMLFVDTTFSGDPIDADLPPTMKLDGTKSGSIPTTDQLSPIDLTPTRETPETPAPEPTPQPPAPQAEPAGGSENARHVQATPVTWTDRPAGLREADLGEDDGEEEDLPSGDLDPFFTED